eukprot:gene4008-6455_t
MPCAKVYRSNNTAHDSTSHHATLQRVASWHAFLAILTSQNRQIAGVHNFWSFWCVWLAVLVRLCGQTSRCPERPEVAGVKRSHDTQSSIVSRKMEGASECTGGRASDFLSNASWTPVVVAVAVVVVVVVVRSSPFAYKCQFSPELISSSVAYTQHHFIVASDLTPSPISYRRLPISPT